MTPAILKTSSRMDDRDACARTQGICSDDWVLPEIERRTWNAGQATTTETLPHSSSNVSATTMPIDGRRVPDPIRKDDLVINFPRDHVKLLQQWECVVSGVHSDCVQCEMHDLTDQSKPVEFAEIYLEEFNHFDRGLLCEGTVFYWSIGHEIKRTGQVRRYSALRVRRMPPLSKLKKREISNRAKRLSELFGSNS